MTSGPALLLAAAVAAAPAGAAMRHERAPRSVVELRPGLVIGGGYYGGAFTSVGGVHCDRRTGEILVADTALNQIEIFDARGAPLFSFADDEHLKGPLRVATDAEDRIHVLDQERSRIKVYSYRGEFQGYVEPPGLGDEKPLLTAIAFDEAGDLWVGDSRSGQVVAYGRGLQPRLRLGTLGQGPGQLDGIVGIALDDAHVYVASQEGIAVHVFTRQGKFLRAWGRHDAGLHNVSLPAGIAVDAKGRVILLDTLRQELKYFDAEGRLIELFGGLGRHAGAVSYPTDLSMDRLGRLCVADGGNRRAQVLQPIEAAPLDAEP
jgi:DNA-binding beta-propeller fold protein YncE